MIEGKEYDHRRCRDAYDAALPGLIYRIENASEGCERCRDHHDHVPVDSRYCVLHGDERLAQIVVDESHIRVARNDPRCYGKIVVGLIRHIRKKQHPGQDCNDRNHDEELYQRKPTKRFTLQV